MGGVKSGEYTEDQGGDDRDDDRGRCPRHGQRHVFADQRKQPHAGTCSYHARGERDDHALGKKEDKNIPPARSKGHAQADLADALLDANHHQAE